MQRALAPWILALLLVGSVAADDFAVEVRRAVEYSTVDGRGLLMDAYLPEGEGPFPAVLVIHGGSWRSGDRHQLSRFARAFAAAGLAAFAIDYRLAPDHKWPAQIEDCRRALDYVRDRSAALAVDPDRVAAFGYSAGGHLAALLGVDGGRLSAVCAGGAPVDFRNIPGRSRGFVYWLGATPAEDPAAYRAASPRAFVSADDPPFLFVHGTDDRLVSPDGPRAMVGDLRAAGVEAGLVEIEGAGHLSAPLHPTMAREAIVFLTRHLSGSDR